MISAVLQSKIKDAVWDAEIARQSGDTMAMLDAITLADELRAQQARLDDPAWLKALQTEM
jgi:hypothetical protein